MLKKQFFLAALLAAASIGASAAGFTKTAAYTPGQFADIPEAEWYAGEVAGAYELGLMNGTGANTFEPNGNVTVAEAITMASRAASIYVGETIPEAEGEWYQKYVNYALSKGLIKEGDFDNYDRAAKRREVAVIFKNALPVDYYTAKNNVTTIPDVSAKSAYANDLLVLYKAGVVMGSDAYGNFFPENNITRAEAAAIINRVALPENRLTKELDITAEDDAYSLILTSAFTLGTEGLVSGWQLDNRGGLPRTTLKEPYGSLFDVSDTAPTALIRPFNKVSTGVIDLDTKISTNAGDGVYMAFANEAEKDIYRLEIKDSAWMLLKADGTSEKLYDIAKDETNFTFEVLVDIDNARSTTYINGKSCGTYPLTLASGIDLTSFRWGTTEASTANVSVSKVNATANYALNESFDFTDSGVLPIGWTGTDGIYANTYSGSNGAALKMDGVQSASTSFSPVGGKIIAEFDHRLPKGESVRYALRSGEKEIVVFTSDDKSFYVNGTTVYETYYKDQWYRMRFELDTDTQTVLVKLNGRKIATVPFGDATTSVDNIAVANLSETEAVLDAFKVFREIEHDDYVPTPVIPAGTDKYTVGMNVCSLWRNGTGSNGGWNCIAAYKDVEPVLGYYDEGNPETADWEIKYTLEHGIDFQAFCVFFESGWGTEPQRPGSTHLNDGFMNAKYSDLAKYAVIWEAANASSPCEWRTWTDSYVPYFIENYFKDPRYVTVDNRPVLCVFGSGTLPARIGGADKVKQMFDYLEEEVKKLGFDGMIYLSCGASSDNLAAMGFDGSYAYNWGAAGYQLDVNKSSILASANIKSMYTVPTISVGFNNMPWAKTRNPMMSASDYAAAHAWVTDEYIPNNAVENWQKELVMLSTWNEYGEGTYIMPTTDEKGFMYLNATREAYTDEKASDAVNVIPTENQRYRINHLYPQELHLLRRQGYYKEEVKDVEYETVYTLDLSNGEGYAPWGVNNPTTDANGVSGVSTDDAIIIYQDLSDKNISLDNVSAVRLTAKIPKNSRAELYYITEDDKSWNQAKHSGFPLSETDEMATYTVSMESHKAFTGKLAGFRIDPVSLPGLNFTVSKLEFLAPVGGKMSKNLYVNGQKCEMFFATQTAENGDLLVAFDPEVGIDFRLNTYHTWNWDTKVLELYFTDHTLVYTVGSDTYTLDGKTKKLPYKLPEIDGLPLLPFKTLCEEVGYTYSLNDNNEISIETPEKSYFEVDTSKRVYGQWEFNDIADTENWKSSFMTLFVNDGYMVCETTGSSTDPTIVYQEKLRMNAADYERIEYRVRYKYNSEALQQLTMYFGTNQSSGLSEDKTIKITLNSNDSKGEWEVYSMNLADVSKWSDMITSLRFDPFNTTGQIDIDYIRFIPKEGVTPGPVSATEVTETKKEETTEAVVYAEPDIPTEDEEWGTLIWYNNFDENDKNAATYAAEGITFSADGVSGNANVVENPDKAKGGNALKITPSGAHGGYAVSFKNKLKTAGEYTFVADIFVPDGAKIDQWLRFETTEADGSSNDPNYWEAEKTVKTNGKWYTWAVTRRVSEGTSINNYSIRKNTAEEYYIDNVRVYRK